MSPTRWWVGIDDTDNAESIGTGRLARWLAEHLEGGGLLAEPSVTRHQFLVDDAIPYTSHNSSACIEGRGDAGSGDALLAAARRFLEANRHAGANPGLCVCAEDGVPPGLHAWAKRAQSEVLELDAFDRALAGSGLALWWSGETGQGRIGAACGVALRASGNDGRFLALRGIRGIEGEVTVGELLARSAVAWVESPDGARLGDAERLATEGWVRPSLRGGRPVFLVRREGDAWVPAERRGKHEEDGA